MKTSIRHIALFLTLVIAGHAEMAQGEFRINCNGVIQNSPSLGRTMWSGTMSMKHPRFQLEVVGQTSLFSGPLLRHKDIGSGRLRAKNLILDHDWISLVALGDIKVTVIESGTNTPPISTRRFVYIPEKDQILLDGKLWQSGARR